MIQHETFPNAPIREAIFDIRAKLPEKINLSILETFQENIKDRFPEKNKKAEWTTPIKIEPDLKPEIGKLAGGVLGFLFKSPEEQKIVQARMNGFTFNKLKPYENWDKFRDEGIELWKRFIELTQPTRISRLALRYINSIDISLESPQVKIEEYLLFGPDTPDHLSYKLSNFLVRLQFYNSEIEANAIVNISLDPVQDEKILPLIFDIDVYKEIDLDPADKIIWEILEDLRNFKNDIFFEGTTEKAKELFR